jgi:hypothetical protein
MVEVLNTISPFDADIEIAGIVLWVLYIGGAAAEGKSERPWFVTNFTLFRQLHSPIRTSAIGLLQHLQLLYLPS